MLHRQCILHAHPSFGIERVDEYIGQGKVSACIVYGFVGSAMHVLQPAPGGRDNARVVTRRFFEDLSLPRDDGRYFLRADRVLAAFIFDLASPPSVIDEDAAAGEEEGGEGAEWGGGEDGAEDEAGLRFQGGGTEGGGEPTRVQSLLVAERVRDKQAVQRLAAAEEHLRRNLARMESAEDDYYDAHHDVESSYGSGALSGEAAVGLTSPLFATGATSHDMLSARQQAILRQSRARSLSRKEALRTPRSAMNRTATLDAGPPTRKPARLSHMLPPAAVATAGDGDGDDGDDPYSTFL